MKKITMFMLGAFAFGALTSCEDAPAEAPMQKNEQGPVLNATEVEISPAAVLSQPLNLDNYVSDPEIELFTVAKDELPEGWNLAPYMELAPTADFDQSYSVPLTVKGDVVYGSMNDVQDAHLNFFGIAERNEQTLYYRVAANIVNANNVFYHYGAPDFYIVKGQFAETPMLSTMPTDFLYTPGTYNNWSATASQFLLAKETDDGYKYYFGSILASGEGFKICNTTDWSGINYGGENGVLSTSGPNIALPSGDGLYWIKAFTEDANPTYQMAKVEKIGIIGAGGNWNDDQELTPNEDFTVWTGDVELSGEWKIRYNGSWDFNYGGSLSYLMMDGSNISGYSGSYTMTITFTSATPRVSLKAK